MAASSESSAMDTIPELPPAPPRESLIVTAVKFLQNPKVAQSPLEQKRQFLVKKGLTSEEIDVAVSRAGVARNEGTVDGLSNHSLQLYHAQEPVSVWTRIRDYSTLAIIIGGVVYGLYSLYKRFIEPIFLKASKAQEEKLELVEGGVKNIKEELGHNMQEIRTTMNELQDQVTAQNMKLGQVAANLTSYKADAGYGNVSNSAIGELKAEITSIKGLLLSRNQFPVQPLMKPAIPSWQLKTPAADLSSGATSEQSEDGASAGADGKDGGEPPQDGNAEPPILNGFAADAEGDAQTGSP